MAQTPTEVAGQFLANTANPTIVKSLVAEDATYVSLNYDNPDLKKIMPWAGTGKGPQRSLTRLRASVSSGRFWPSLLKSCSGQVTTSLSLADSLTNRRHRERLSNPPSRYFPASTMARSFTSNSWRTPLRRQPASNPAEAQDSIATRLEKRSKSSTDRAIRRKARSRNGSTY